MNDHRNREASGGPTAVSIPLVHPAPRPAALAGQLHGVLLDMCNVLYDNTVWRRWVLHVLSRLGLHTSYRSLFRLWDRDYLPDVNVGKASFGEAFRAFLLSLGLSRGQVDEVEAACQSRRRQLDATARPLPGVKSTLGRLHQAGLALAAVADSEHPAAMLREQLDHFRLGRLFTAVVSSIDLERTMPDKACYLTAVEALNLPPQQVAFVGHDTLQLAGAAALGMPTIAFNYDLDARADFYVGRFEELLGLLGVAAPWAAAG